MRIASVVGLVVFGCGSTPSSPAVTQAPPRADDSAIADAWTTNVRESRSTPTPTAATHPFYCERTPARVQHRVRSCFRYAEHCKSPAGCFERANAICYARSSVDGTTDEWVSESSQVMCFPSPSDCADDWKTWAQRPQVGPDRHTMRPPLLTPCRESRPVEADY